MSALMNSLRKQNEFLQREVERFANAIDDLAEQLAQARAQLEAKQEATVASEKSGMRPADEATIISSSGEAAKS